MPTYWTGFWSKDPRPITEENPGFFHSGTGWTNHQDGELEYSICVWVEAEDQAALWKIIRRYYPKARERFVNEREFVTSDRFPDAKIVRK